MCLLASYPAVPGVLKPCESRLVAADTVSTPTTVRTIHASATRRRWRRARRVIEFMAGKARSPRVACRRPRGRTFATPGGVVGLLLNARRLELRGGARGDVQRGLV